MPSKLKPNCHKLNGRHVVDPEPRITLIGRTPDGKVVAQETARDIGAAERVRKEWESSGLKVEVRS